jgi:hypothetical protein
MWTGFWNWLAGLPPSSATFLGTLTGSGLGLVALLVGALFNAHLNRRRDDRLREEDRRALAAALRAELGGIYRTLLENATHLTDKKPEAGTGFMVPDLVHSVQVMPHMLPKIGLLDPETIRKLIDAYVLVAQYCEGLIMLGGELSKEHARRQTGHLHASG